MAMTHPTETETSSLLLNGPPNPCFLQTLVALSAISGFLFGFDTGIVSGALVLVKDDFPLSSLQHETVVSATILQWHGDEALRGAAPPAAGGGARGDAAREAGDRGGAVGGGGVQRVILPRQWQKRRSLSYTRNK